MCARHIYARWGKRPPGKELQILFWNIARSTSEPEMQGHLQKMKELKGGGITVEELLERWPISGWCATYFNDVVKCHVIDNNICETFNGVMLEARSKPVITMLEEIRRYVMQRMIVKRNCVKKWKVDFGPNIIAKLETERSKSGKWQVDWNGATKHEVY